LYINRHSNHPPSITRQLPTAINKRIALLSESCGVCCLDKYSAKLGSKDRIYF
jgi:uncharacterized cysteine cluster protein YcgN (CxxCxxCC family)